MFGKIASGLIFSTILAASLFGNASAQDNGTVPQNVWLPLVSGAPGCAVQEWTQPKVADKQPLYNDSIALDVKEVDSEGDAINFVTELRDTKSMTQSVKIDAPEFNTPAFTRYQVYRVRHLTQTLDEPCVVLRVYVQQVNEASSEPKHLVISGVACYEPGVDYQSNDLDGVFTPVYALANVYNPDPAIYTTSKVQ